MPIPIGVLAQAGAGSAGGPNFINIFGGPATERAYSIGLDSSLNVYTGGWTDTSGRTQWAVQKMSSLGQLIFQRRLENANNNSYIEDLAFDSSNNFYTCGFTDQNSFDIFITKNNSNGVLQWQRSLGSSNRDDVGYGIAVDSSGSSYITGYHNNGSTYDWLTAKYNTNGTLQWQRRFGGNGVSHFPYKIAVDGSGNCYVSGYTTGTTEDFTVIKYNTNGNLQWQRRLLTTAFDASYGIKADSSGNVYVSGISNANGFQDVVTAKYDTNGNLLWQRIITSASEKWSRGLVLDSSNNIYVSGMVQATPSVNNYWVVKYNTNGTILWQRQMGAATTLSNQAISVDNAGYYYITGFANSIGEQVTIKLPDNGSGIGSYNFSGYTWTYSATTLTDSAASLSNQTTSFTDQSGSLTDSTTNWTQLDTNLTFTTFNF